MRLNEMAAVKNGSAWEHKTQRCKDAMMQRNKNTRIQRYNYSS